MRPVAGDAALAAKAVALRDRYVYSGHPLELGKIRHLRQRQASALVEPGTVNVTYGAGGLVDVGYDIQACPVAARNTDLALRLTNTIDAIGRLAERGYLASERAVDIRAAYAFLRRLIDALRVVRGNARDPGLPDQGSREFRYLAQRHDFGSPAGLAEAIFDCMKYAGGIWD